MEFQAAASLGKILPVVAQAPSTARVRPCGEDTYEAVLLFESKSCMLDCQSSNPCRQVPKGYKVVKEGMGSILEFKNDAFYNPAQVCSCPLEIT